MEPRHPPNALTSLTTRNVALSAAPAALSRQACAWRAARPAASSRSGRWPSHHVYNRRRRAWVTRVEQSHRNACFDFVLHAASGRTEGTLRVARSISCLTSSSRNASRRDRVLVRASHFVQLFDFQDRRYSAGRVGQERLELSTPRLSSVCSNQLSYWPVWLIGLSRPNSKSVDCGRIASWCRAAHAVQHRR